MVPIVRVRFYAIPLTIEEVNSFMDRHHPDPVLNEISKCSLFLDIIGHYLSTKKVSLAYVEVPPGEGSELALGIVMASNLNHDEIDKHKDRRLVQEVQKVLGGTHTSPLTRCNRIERRGIHY